MSLEETKTKLLEESQTTKSFFIQLKSLYMKEINSEGKYLVESLSQLHNSKEINLIDLIQAIDTDFSENNYHIIIRTFERTLASLEASVEDVLHCLAHLARLTSLHFTMTDAFENFCKNDINRPEYSIKVILSQKDLSAYAVFLPSSIRAYHSDDIGLAIETIISLTSNEEPTIRQQAYFTLIGLRIDENYANTIWDLLYYNSINESSSQCKATILRAVMSFGSKYPDYWQQIEELLTIFFENITPNIQSDISDIAAFQNLEFPERILHLLLNQLKRVSPEQKQVISNIDYLLVNLAEQELSCFAIDLLESILTEGVSIRSLSYFSNELLSKHDKLLGTIITKWFISGEHLLCEAILDLLECKPRQDTELKADLALLNKDIDQIRVSHKAVGFLFTQPVEAASFILSIYEIASIDTQEQLEQVLYDPLFLSYPNKLETFFQSCIKEDQQKLLCEGLIKKITNYHSGLKKASGLKELMAPAENVGMYWKSFNNDMRAAREDTTKSSMFSLIPKRKILYGNSSVFYAQKANGEQVRQEVQMHTFSQSAELPRLNSLDPESLDYQLRMYRYKG